MKTKLALTLMMSMLFSAVAFSTEHTVEMKSSGASGIMVFEPAVINVSVGDTVHFLPTDISHNSESVQGLTPKGAVAWKGNMNKKVSVTVDKEGVYVYKCMPHTMMGMVGVIVAGKPINLAEIKKNSETLTATFVMNKDRLAKYLSEVK